jgi:hypothetical protein
MPLPSEHKSVQNPILKYAVQIGWTYFSREEADKRRVWGSDITLFFVETIYNKVTELNPLCNYNENELLRELSTLKPTILIKIIEEENRRKEEQVKKGFDGLTFFIYKTLLEHGFNGSDIIATKVKEAFQTYSNWKSSDKEYRELRQEITLLLMGEKDMDEAVKMVEDIFRVLNRVKGIF